MLEIIINNVVMVLFGIFLGVLLEFFMLLSPEYDSAFPRKKRNQSWTEYFNEIHQKMDEQNKQILNAPKSFLMVYATLVAFVTMLILVVIYSPLTMNWLYFLPSFFVAFAIAEGIMGKKGLIRRRRREKI